MMNFKITLFKDWRGSHNPLKMLLFSCLFLGLLLNSNNFIHAQTVPLESSLHVNFGVDADVYSGLFSFSPNPAAGTDDWLQGTSGLGVIDETNAADIAMSMVSVSVDSSGSPLSLSSAACFHLITTGRGIAGGVRQRIMSASTRFCMGPASRDGA